MDYDGDKFRVYRRKAEVLYQQYMDLIVPYPVPRWVAFGIMIALFLLRIILAQGYYVIAYASGIHILYLLVMMITPINNPEETAEVNLDDEAKPFVPQLGEFKAWKQMMRVVLIAFPLTFVPFLDIPVFWPILLLYFFILLFAQLGARIKHMRTYKYVPWNTRKNMYVAKETRVL